ncbi:NADH dehydrogenase [ubiquinone] 1 beta subcomplex subunit 7 [Microplitis demolitor]|uniref:NADH dehydrogenase [ubiquinone] 1 beta subcomplex subunit 7 n=1 Tax=Microplitis demolitor TaxID=69319 RepID=UPI0004CDCECD|nr:NADH dehydrogenase [ubiquinone] 1 beta subcomplex subunit 7 [Microplitis demolitor]
MGSAYSLFMEPDVTPIGDTKPSFPTTYGFEEGRKPRVMIATEQEMTAAMIPAERRDYCAHHYLKLEQCRYDNVPWMIKCSAEKHAWDVCAYEDYVLRMKEYERERRLLVRQKRKQQKEAAAA